MFSITFAKTLRVIRVEEHEALHKKRIALLNNGTLVTRKTLWCPIAPRRPHQEDLMKQQDFFFKKN